MDKYLYLLKRNEHVMLQNIDLSEPQIMGRDFRFKPTRDKVNLIIICKNRNIILKGLGNDVSGLSEEDIKRIVKNGEKEEQDFESELVEEERRIREVISGELKRRRDEETPEERPLLPNYDDQESQEPHDEDWENDYDDFPYDDNEELEESINRLEGQRSRGGVLLSELKRIENGQQTRFQWPGGAREIEKELEELYPHNLLSDFENYYSDCYSNFQLKLLDDRIRQIRQYRSRLHAGNLLGYFTRYWNKAGVETERTIRLFLDNIESAANGMCVNGIQVDRSEILANVYIHELFHAYYSQGLTQRHAWVSCINEVEEAMAEFGMLCFVAAADVFAQSPRFLQIAEQCVNDKLNTPNLRHYGLGFCMYQTWNQHCFNGSYIFNGNLLSIYQNIQLSIRNSRKKVSYLKHTLMNNVPNMPYQFNHSNCIKVIYDLFYLYDYIKKNKTQHYSFDGKTYGCNNRMVYAVLDYYNSRNNPTYNNLVNDFRLLRHQWFENVQNIQRNQTRYYDFDRQLTLSDGTIIVPMHKWESELTGNTIAFIKEVDMLYRRGKLDKHVLYLG